MLHILRAPVQIMSLFVYTNYKAWQTKAMFSTEKLFNSNAPVFNIRDLNAPITEQIEISKSAGGVKI